MHAAEQLARQSKTLPLPALARNPPPRELGEHLAQAAAAIAAIQKNGARSRVGPIDAAGPGASHRRGLKSLRCDSNNNVASLYRLSLS